MHVHTHTHTHKHLLIILKKKDESWKETVWSDGIIWYNVLYLVIGPLVFSLFVARSLIFNNQHFLSFSQEWRLTSSYSGLFVLNFGKNSSLVFVRSHWHWHSVKNVSFSFSCLMSAFLYYQTVVTHSVHHQHPWITDTINFKDYLSVILPIKYLSTIKACV